MKEKNSKVGNIIYHRIGAGVCALAICASLSTVHTGRNILALNSNTDSSVNTVISSHLDKSISALEATPGVTLSEGKIHYNLPGIPSRYLWKFESMPISINGKATSIEAITVNGITYLPLQAFCESIAKTSYNYNPNTRTAVVKLNGLEIQVTDGGYVMYANGRTLFSFSPAILMSNNRMYVSGDNLCKALGVKLATGTGKVSITGKYTPLKTASAFYREDEVYWLAKIINAEAKGESLLGQIAVGDVILNRVKSNLYPNTIYGVIYDRKYGVQFSPILDGRIKEEPGYTSILAAKICLDGTSLTDNAMYFLNPVTAQSNWIVKNRQYAYTIGNHDFYI